MRALSLPAIACALAVVSPSAQQPDAIAAASRAIGATDLESVTFSAIGASFSVGQNPNPEAGWPRVTLKSYEAAVNFETASMRVEMLREQGAVPPRGGGRPFTGRQRLIQLISGNDAWDVQPPPEPPLGPFGAPPPPAPKPGDKPAAPPPPPPPPQPQPAAVVERMLQIWLTPHGFLKAAASNGAATRRVEGGTEVSFTMAGGHPFTGIIDERNQVARVRTWIDNPVLGDMPVEAVYRDYSRVDGVLFPMHIIQSQGGHPSLELWLTSVQPNAAADITAPDSVRGAAPPPVSVEARTIADGVWYLTGGSHHSVAVEMRDHLVMIEAPLSEARSRAVVAKMKELLPAKPIRFVVNTHHHFDHAGGLRTYVDQGAVIVTHEMNRAFYETAWAAPRTLNPDALARSNRAATFQTFADKQVLTDGTRIVAIHRIANSPHHEGFAMVYLPAEKILVEADAYTPAPPAPPPDPAAKPPELPPGPPAFVPPPVYNPATVNLYQNLERLKLDAAVIAALHGPRLATMEDLARAIGRDGN
jgi:glyoxylase-like metal-dependent hydrolase (beta-lactamase superfamily II)